MKDEYNMTVGDNPLKLLLLTFLGYFLFIEGFLNLYLPYLYDYPDIEQHRIKFLTLIGIFGGIFIITIRSKPWYMLNSNIKKILRTFWSGVIALLSADTLYLIPIYLKKNQIEYGIVQYLLFLFFWFLLYYKFSEKFLSKALEKGGIFWKGNA